MASKRPQRAHERAHTKTASRAQGPESRLFTTFFQWAVQDSNL